jgi:hypothetical protein
MESKPLPIVLRDDQFDIVLSSLQPEYKYTVMIGGRRYGKTTIIEELMLMCMRAEGEYLHYMTANPSQYEELWNRMLDMFEAKSAEERRAMPYYVKNKNGSRRIIYFNTGSRIYFHSATSKRTINKPRGGKADKFIFDECQDFNSELLEQASNAVAAPMLIDRNGIMYFFGTIPYVPNHYFTKLYVMGAYKYRGLDTPEANEIAGPDVPFELYRSELEEAEAKGMLNYYNSIRKPTSANFYMKKHALAAFINSMPAPVVAREVEAKFTYSTSNLFCAALDDDKTARYRIFTDKDLDILPYEPIYISFDFNNNPMPAVVCQYKSDFSEIRVLKDFGSAAGDTTKRTILTTLAEIKDYIRSIKHKWSNGKIYITGDASGDNWQGSKPDGKSFLREILDAFNLTHDRLIIQRSNPRHKDSYHQLYNFMMHHPKLFISKHCPRLIADMLKAERIDFNINKSVHDPHFLDAFRYFLINIIKISTPPKSVGRINTLDQLRAASRN